MVLYLGMAKELEGRPYTKFGMTTTVQVIGKQGRKLNTPSTPKMHNPVLLVTKLTDTTSCWKSI